eukprot:scaffold23370_cov120-Isochrysis_galbana.AAC.9
MRLLPRAPPACIGLCIARTCASSLAPKSFVPSMSTHTAGSRFGLLPISESRPGWIRQPTSCTRSPPRPRLTGNHLQGRGRGGAGHKGGAVGRRRQVHY